MITFMGLSNAVVFSLGDWRDTMERKLDIGSDNSVISSCNKPLPEPMLTQILVAIWRH